MIFIGLDIAPSGAAPVTLAVLSGKLAVEELEEVTVDEAISAVNGHEAVHCAINAASSPNQGHLADAAYREKVGLPPGRDNYSGFRVCEYELRQRGIPVSNTPADEIREWMREGWRLHQSITHPTIETQAYAAFTVLIGKRPYPRRSFEGRLQRQLVLYQEGLDLPDPMHTLEEWTRHRLLTGTIDMSPIYEYPALDALMAAHTAFLTEKEPHNITKVGDPAEGQITLPVGELKAAY